MMCEPFNSCLMCIRSLLRSQLLGLCSLVFQHRLLSDFGRRHLGKFCRSSAFTPVHARRFNLRNRCAAPALGVACTLCIHSVHHRFTNLPVAMGLDGAISSGMD